MTAEEAPDFDSRERDNSNESKEPEPDVAEVELTEEDFGGEDLFADIEDSEQSSTADHSDADDLLGELDDRGGQLEEAINDGAARLAVVGLEDPDDLEEEFQEVFAAFRLGFFGSRFTEEYILLSDDEEIDPAWGLLGAAMCCMAVTLWMRPDGDEQMRRFQSAMSTIAGGASA